MHQDFCMSGHIQYVNVSVMICCEPTESERLCNEGGKILGVKVSVHVEKQRRGTEKVKINVLIRGENYCYMLGVFYVLLSLSALVRPIQLS